MRHKVWEREGVEKRERKYMNVCVPVNVDLRESRCREFGRPYINQFHFHRDRGMSGGPAKGNSLRLWGGSVDSFRMISISQFFVRW